MSVELVIATPLMLLLVLSVAQFALWAHASHIARAAANSGVQTTRAYGSTTDAGQQDAILMLDQLAGTVLTHTRVQTDRGPATATVTVTGQAITVIPGLHLPVRATATAPRELVPGVP